MDAVHDLILCVACAYNYTCMYGVLSHGTTILQTCQIILVIVMIEIYMTLCIKTNEHVSGNSSLVADTKSVEIATLW